MAGEKSTEAFKDMMARLDAEIKKRKEKAGVSEEPKKEEPKKEEPKVESKKEEPKKEEIKKVETVTEKVPEVPKEVTKVPEKDAVKSAIAILPDGDRRAFGSLEFTFSKLLENAIEKGIIASQIASSEAKPVKIRVSKTFKDGELVTVKGGDVETIETPLFIGPTANVSISMGHTINMGDYQSCKIDVFIAVPCHLGEEGAAYDYAKKFVMDRLCREVKDIKAVKEGKE